MLPQAGNRFNPVGDRLPRAGLPRRRKPRRPRPISDFVRTMSLSAPRAASALPLFSAGCWRELLVSNSPV